MTKNDYFYTFYPKSIPFPEIRCEKQQYGKYIKIYNARIPLAVKAAESSLQGKSIYSYDKNSPVAIMYAQFTKEVMRDGEKTRDRLRSSEAR